MKKRADGNYQKQITIEVNGKKKQKCFYGKTIKEVNQKILDYKGEIEKGRLFSEVADEWWEEHQKTLAPNSLKSLKPAVGRAIAKFKDVPIKQLSGRDVLAFINQFSKRGYAQKTVTTQLQAVRQILDYALETREILFNVSLNVRHLPKDLKKIKREPPSDKIIRKIVAGTGEYMDLFAKIALYTGARRGEILALQYKDIDFANKKISITKSVYHVGDKPYIKTPKTEAGKRDVILIPELEKLIPKMKPDDYIINDNGKLLTNRRFITLWDKYIEALGEKFTPHQLRHNYATRLHDMEIDVRTAQYLLGHADIATTQNIYTHITERKLKATADTLKDFSKNLVQEAESTENKEVV